MLVLTYIPLLLGILTPHSHVTTMLNALAAGMILAKLPGSKYKYAKNKWVLPTITIIIYIIIILTQWGFLYGLTAGLSIYGGYLLIKNNKYLRSRYIPVILTVLIINLFASVYVDGKTLRTQLDTIPLPAYTTDMAAYLKTYYLLEDNQAYYSAFATTIKGRLDGAFPGEVWGWKQPLVFYVWSLLTNSGQGIAYLAAGLFSITFISIYKMIKKISNPILGIMSVYMVFPYFHYPLVEMTVIQVEWWALAVCILGMWAFTSKRYLLTGSLFALCLSIRELYAIPMIAIWSLLLFQKQFRNAIIVAAPIAFAFFPYFFFIHLQNVAHYEGSQIFQSFARSNAASGWTLVRTTLAYNAWSYALGTLKLFHLLILATSTGLIVAITKTKKKIAYAALLVSFLVFFILSFKLKMMNTWHDYWGIYYMPMVLLATPIALQSFKHLTKHVK